MSQRNSIEMCCVCVNGLLDREDRLQCYNPRLHIFYIIYIVKSNVSIYLFIYLATFKDDE